MKTVLLVGNSGGGINASDGGSIKVNLYRKCLESNNVKVFLADLFKWGRNPIRVLFKIFKNFKKSDVILIMGGPNGSRMLIPFIVRLNVFFKKRLVYCPLGIGTIEKVIQKCNPDEAINFINCHDFYGLNDKKIGRYLSKLSLIIPQNDTLTNLYKNFYNLNNVSTILNFRDVAIKKRDFRSHNPFKIIYLSRIAEEKGIFLLMDAVNHINGVSLDIFGQNQLNKEQNLIFDEIINNNPFIRYCGVCGSENTIDLLEKYDLFCLPTKYKGEGTSGSFIESLIAGTPTLLSTYSQAKQLIVDGMDGFLFNINDLSDLIKKIEFIKTVDLKRISESSQNNAKRYVFSYNKKMFFEAILGEDITNE